MHSSATDLAEPAYCDRHSLTLRSRRSPLRFTKQSLGGHSDFPRHYPGASASAGGLRRYEPENQEQITPFRGKFMAYPTRNFATLGPFACCDPTLRRTVGFDSSTHSACRHAVRTFSSPTSVCVSEPGVKSLRIPQPFGTTEIFPADRPHLPRCHRRRRR